MRRKESGVAVFYTRDSGGKHEMTPSEYIEWGRKEATKRGLSFCGKPATIQRMIDNGEAELDGIYLDYDVKGNTLSRRGLDALKARVENDFDVTHVFIPRRDRLARPDHPVDGMELERFFQSQGITLVFMDRSVSPVPKGKRADVVDSIIALLDYDRSGGDRRTLADKIIRAQIGLAKRGYSTGGRPPYGFKRCLVKEDGTQVRDLADGERVKMAGHHVAWIPDEGPRLETALRIRRMLRSMPATQVAKALNEEGVPSPDAGRKRTDNGAKHPVSGTWNITSINNIGRNSLIAAIARYGVRSMGDQLRFTPDGPRELGESDYRVDDGEGSKPKVIRNAAGSHVQAAAKFTPLESVEDHEELQRILDERAGVQKGKPHARDPDMNPLGARVFDMNCGWLMYREPYNKSFRYKCGLYIQSHGMSCEHNHVPGPVATQFMLSCIQQRLQSPSLLPKLKQRLLELATSEAQTSDSKSQLKVAEAALASVQQDVERVEKNLARAESDRQFKAIAKELDRLSDEEKTLKADIQSLRVKQTLPKDVGAAVERALEIAARLTKLAASANTFREARQLFEATDAKLYLQFEKRQVGKRELNKLVSGVATFGKTPSPIKLYDGPTARKTLDRSARRSSHDSTSPSDIKAENTSVSGGGGESLRNVSRGD